MNSPSVDESAARRAAHVCDQQRGASLERELLEALKAILPAADAYLRSAEAGARTPRLRLWEGRVEAARAAIAKAEAWK